MSKGRGEGYIYNGSVVSAQGAVVSVMYDCECSRCGRLEPWDENRRVVAVLEDGRTLLCAGTGSFLLPESVRRWIKNGLMSVDPDDWEELWDPIDGEIPNN